MSVNFNENGYYDGFRTFTWLADLCGLSVDLINFLICQITGLFLASLYRSILHPSKVSTLVRHTIALTQGLAFGYFCFGRQAVHIAGLPTACYIVMRTQNPRIVQRTVMLVAMIYLLCIHLIRQIYDYGSYALDITGPLMIITQKVTSLAFSIHDGFIQANQELTTAQQYHAVKNIPSVLEYFSYMLHFQSLMAGPLVFYKDYIEFIEGYNFKRNSNRNLDNGRSNQMVMEPSPIKPVVKKLFSSIICALLFMKMSKVYPVKNMKEDDFIYNTSILYKVWYIYWSTMAVRFKYYHAWLLADAICNNSGLGFNGYNKDETAKWDLISNINVFSFEFSTNMRDALNKWNIGTNRWLRSVVYERVPRKYGTLLTFSLSAVWHGFYPGYYITFATGALMVASARMARRMFKHRFEHSHITRMFYDILTCLTTRIVMCYCVFPFVLLEFMASAKLYLKFYCGLHILALIIIYLLPRFIRGEEWQQPVRFKRDEMTINSLPHAIKKKKSKGQEKSSIIDVMTSKNLEFQNIRIITDSLRQDEATNVSKTYSNNVFNVHLTHLDQCTTDQLSENFEERNYKEQKIAVPADGMVGVNHVLRRDCELVRVKEISSPSLRQQHTRKREVTRKHAHVNNGTENVRASNDTAFLKMEINAINAVVQQANNMFPAILSNGHGK